LASKLSQEALDYRRIENAILFLEKNFCRQPELNEIASAIGLSEFHFQRLFKRWVGISPKRFIQYLTKEYAKTLLEKSQSILSVTYDSGLSSPGRLHDLFVTCEAVTPGEYSARGIRMQIIYGFHKTRFGDCLFAQTKRGICGLYFIQNGQSDIALKRLKKKWSAAQFTESNIQTSRMIEQIFSPLSWYQSKPFHLLLSGTNFQIKVWEALLKIPQGYILSYEDIALKVRNNRTAVRAVGNAVASNPISFLIPCHRVIRKLGVIGNYQGGSARKKALLGWEFAQNELNNS
jgi:AraC family transcriptional regulator of adaptative response/methylated-DNA-[protein]-cysteine methyltransferase